MNLLTVKLAQAYAGIYMAAANGTTFLTKARDYTATGVTVFGSFYAAWGTIHLVQGWKDKNGPDMQQGMWQLISGVVMIAIATYIKTIDITFS